MKTIWAAISVLLVAGHVYAPADAEDKPTAEAKGKLFEYVKTANSELTATQQKVLGKLKGDRTAADVQIVRLSPDAFDGDSLELNLSDGTTLQAKKARRYERPQRGFTWSGQIQPSADTGPDAQVAHFSISDGDGSGSFNVKKFTYNLRPLGNGLHVLIKRDPSKIKDEEPPEAMKKLEEEATKKEKPAANPMAEANPNHTVTVMVLYTPAVKGNHPSPTAFVNSVIDITNACYRDSKVPITLESAHVDEIAYTESGSVAQDVDRLSGKNDGVIDGIHALRNQHSADLTVMLIDHADAYGMADAILASEATAFAVVDDEVADWYFTFAHELGHLFGCRHNPGADPSTSPFPYGHCFCNGPKQWRTIMSYDCTGQSARIGIFSSPHLKHPAQGGDPAGDAVHCDNCRVLRETAATIAGFR